MTNNYCLPIYTEINFDSEFSRDAMSFGETHCKIDNPAGETI